MSTEIKEFDFPLTRVVNYANQGETVEGTFIKFTAPSAKQLIHCVILKQAFFRAISFFEERIKGIEKEEKDDEKMDASAIIGALYMSDVDMVKILLQAKELFNSGVALMDGEVKLTKPMMDDMAQEDLENMTGEYMANFILSSVLKGI